MTLPAGLDMVSVPQRLAEERFYGCARWGCDAVNASWESYGAGGRSYCLHHRPGRLKRYFVRPFGALPSRPWAWRGRQAINENWLGRNR
jgi:hypothetical protein